MATWFAILLLVSCSKTPDRDYRSSGPISVFDETWKTLDERYALFPVKNIDWDSVYTVFRPRVNDEMAGSELAVVLADMLETLKDGHVSILADGRRYTYQGFFENYPANFNKQIVLENYLESSYRKLGPVIFKVKDNIGYVFYESFSNDLSQQQAAELFTALAGTKGLIIDVRSNGGGNSANAERILGHLVSDRRVIRYEQGKKGKGHNDFQQPMAYYSNPVLPFYQSPVILLTNRRCYSTCNDFALYLSSLPDVRQLGDQTGGGGSVPVEYRLGNGWLLQYSATLTLDTNLHSVEDGILPEISIIISPVDEFNGRDPILEKAIQLLQ